MYVSVQPVVFVFFCAPVWLMTQVCILHSFFLIGLQLHLLHTLFCWAWRANVIEYSLNVSNFFLPDSISNYLFTLYVCPNYQHCSVIVVFNHICGKSNKMFHWKNVDKTSFSKELNFKVNIKNVPLNSIPRFFVSNNSNFVNTGPMMQISTPH